MYTSENNFVQTQCPFPLSYERILQVDLQQRTLTDGDQGYLQLRFRSK